MQPKQAGQELAVNQALFNCMKAKEPIIVLEQLSNKTSLQGAQYRLMGLGLIESYNPTQDLFLIQHVDFATLERISYGEKEDVLIASILRSNTLEQFIPFVTEDKAIYKISAQKRDRAF